MNHIRVSRRTAFGLTCGAAVLAGTGLPAAALQDSSNASSAEIEAIRKNIGAAFQVSDGEISSIAVLEEVVELTPKVRPPFTVGHRTPFAVVFRQNGGDAISDGTFTFSSDGIGGSALMVSCFTADDGIKRLEAVFN